MPQQIRLDGMKPQPVATKEELLEFANRVRQAGGANVLEALLPSRPGSARTCLIANALNFSCRVDGISRIDADGNYLWGMYLPENMSADQAEAIAASIGCEYVRYTHHSYGHAIVLPATIGNAAHAFDLGLAFTDLVAPDDA